jgi:hypothetical protein
MSLALLWLLLQVRDAGNLLTRADLAMPTVDLDTFVMHYSSAVSESTGDVYAGSNGIKGCLWLHSGCCMLS